MSVKLLTGHRLEFVGLKADCTGSSESTLVKMPYCWKSHVAAQFMSRCVRYAGYIHISKKRKNSDKYHKSSFSCMQCAVSCSSSLKLFFVFMQTHEKGDTSRQLCFVCYVRFHAPKPPRATRVLKQQQQHVV